MKQNWIYPLLIVIAASSYGILSTIVKVAMQAWLYICRSNYKPIFVRLFTCAHIIYFNTAHIAETYKIRGINTYLLQELCTAITGIVYGQSLNYLPASLAVVMLFQFTWIGLFMDCIIKKRLPSRIELISLAFLFAGTILAAGIIDVDLSQIAWQGWALD